MKYTNIIEEFTWSYSRIKQYENCPYGFLLKYIKKIPPCRHFFSDYGSYVHSIIQEYLIGNLRKEELPLYYLSNFYSNINERAPSQSIFSKYFNQGLSYFKNIVLPNGNILGVEKEVLFKLDNFDFIAFIDIVLQNDGIIIVDNKSRNLKPRSGKKKPTKSDIELDNYLRQLYIYSIPIFEQYGCYPKSLVFNCFRNKEIITESFSEEVFENTKNWAKQTINNILHESEWNPNISWFKCRYLCDCNYQCDYWKMFN